MEFDKSKVYTALNADKLEIGSKCIFADTLTTLKNLVRCDDGTYGTLKSINDESFTCRFAAAERNISYGLAYLVEEPTHLKWSDLHIGDVIRRDAVEHMIVSMDYKEGAYSHVFVADTWLTNEELAYWTKVSYLEV